jgi:hypothetical protein
MSKPAAEAVPAFAGARAAARGGRVAGAVGQPLDLRGRGDDVIKTVDARKVGRNDPPLRCGKKYKKCHGTAA